MTLLSAAVLLVLVMDPFGNVPFFAAALEAVEVAREWSVIEIDQQAESVEIAESEAELEVERREVLDEC